MIGQIHASQTSKAYTVCNDNATERPTTRAVPVYEGELVTVAGYGIFKDPARVCNLRYDALGEMLNRGNVHYGSRVLVVDQVQGYFNP